mmetsp:Transcript_16815/g.40551  ORF Transcript_16815/g.40551 Transcript_16815/m.40551 type:complete len:447 (-) Transcript_16815:82-1422(-)
MHRAVLLGDIAEIRLLVVEQPESVNCKNLCGATPLYLAASQGRVEALKLLLEAHADPLIAQNGGATALDVAKQKRNYEVVQILQGASHQPGLSRTPRERSSAPLIPSVDIRHVAVHRATVSPGRSDCSARSPSVMSPARARASTAASPRDSLVETRITEYRKVGTQWVVSRTTSPPRTPVSQPAVTGFLGGVAPQLDDCGGRQSPSRSQAQSDGAASTPGLARNCRARVDSVSSNVPSSRGSCGGVPPRQMLGPVGPIVRRQPANRASETTSTAVDARKRASVRAATDEFQGLLQELKKHEEDKDHLRSRLVRFQEIVNTANADGSVDDTASATEWTAMEGNITRPRSDSWRRRASVDFSVALDQFQNLVVEALADQEETDGGSSCASGINSPIPDAPMGRPRANSRRPTALSGDFLNLLGECRRLAQSITDEQSDTDSESGVPAG